MAKRSALTIERLREVLRYEPETGKFFWRVKTAKGTTVGAEVPMKPDSKGYRFISIDRCDHLAQRLAWGHVHGAWPKHLTFLDRDQSNVKLSNLIEKHTMPKKYDHDTREGRLAYYRDRRDRFGKEIRATEQARRFGISTAQVAEMVLAQNGLCAVCLQPETSVRNGRVRALAIDHNHTTGAVRALLCTSCNTMIGHARESIETLERAIAYLKRHATELPDNVVLLHQKEA